MTGSDKRLLVLGTQFESWIASAVLDEQAGTLTELSRIETPVSPDWVTKHPKHDIVYAATRPETGGKVGVYRVSPEGAFTFVEEAETGLIDPCAMEVFPDLSGLVIAHFLGGGVTVLPLNSDGTLARHSPEHVFLPKHTPQKNARQQSAHPHHVVLHNDEIIIPDQGCNRVWRLKYSYTEGFELLGSIDEFDEEDAPRFGVVHPNGKIIYILNEISSYVSIHTLPAPGEPSKRLDRIAIFPPCDSENVVKVPMTSSAIVMWNGKIICSNRKSINPEMDALAVLEILDDGLLGTPLFVWPRAKHLRGLAPSPDGKYVATAGRDAGGVVVYNSKWKEVGRLKIDMVAIPVWMN